MCVKGICVTELPPMLIRIRWTPVTLELFLDQHCWDHSMYRVYLQNIMSGFYFLLEYLNFLSVHEIWLKPVTFSVSFFFASVNLHNGIIYYLTGVLMIISVVPRNISVTETQSQAQVMHKEYVNLSVHYI